MENKRYYIELEVLTPLSVGAGNENDWICGVDYVQKDGKVYVIDMERAARLGIDLERLAVAFARSDQRAIINLIGNRLEQASSRIYDSPVETTNPIKSFLRTQLMDKPVVPGSSLKGAIRSCLFNDFHGHIKSDEDKNKMKDINDQVFGTMKEGDVFTRFIHIGDIVMPQTRLVNTKLFNLRGRGNDWNGGWKQSGRETTANYQPTGFNTLYECVLPGSKGIGAIDMTNHAFELLCKKLPKQAYLDKKQHLMQGGIRALFHIINVTTRNYLEKEREFFETYHTDRVDELIDTIDGLLNKIPADDSYCVMKMSAGVGFHSITGDWLYDDYCDEPGFWPDNDKRNAGKKMYKSRKIAEYNKRLQLMGFVILRSIDTDGEVTYHNHLERMKVSDAQLRAEAEAAVRQKAIEDDQKRREQAAQRRELENKYDSIMDEAKALAEANKWDEAIAKANEAAELIPEREDHATWIKGWEQQKAIDAASQAAKEAADERYKQPLAKVLNPTSLGNVIGTAKKWLASNGGEKAFGETELQALFTAIQALPAKEVKQLDRKRKDIVKVLGEQWTANLYELFV
jgi:hypothetical protein